MERSKIKANDTKLLNCNYYCKGLRPINVGVRDG